jgi:hypothetical protein
MRSTKAEQIRAEQVSAAVDKLLKDPETEPGQLHVGAEDRGLLVTAQRLARLPGLLGPMDPALEERVLSRARAGGQAPRRVARLRAGWAVASVAAVLLAVMLLTPMGQTAVASFMAVFNLGRTEVRITPVYTPSALQATAVAQSTAVQQTLSLEEAEEQVSFAIPRPAYVPHGYHLQGAVSNTYPDLPAWVPQPFFVDLVYEDGQGHTLSLRVYPIILGDKASISGMNLQAAPIQEVQDVDVGGQPGVLLRLGADRGERAWQEVVWEHGDLILALSASDLTESELLRMARSVR